MRVFVGLLGALPALVAMANVDRLDARRPEPRKSLRRVAVAGKPCVFPCGLIELGLMRMGPALTTYAGALYTGVVVAAIIEELANILCVRAFG